MNKKLVLSVLSTALVASMASAAMAKPSAGIYIGGDVDKYYSAIPFLDNFDAALDEILDNLEDSVFVDPNGNAAKLSDALSADDINTVLKPATEADFEANDYKVVGEEGKVWNPEDETDWPPVVPGELKVESVSAINGKQVEIKFATAVDEDTVVDGSGKLLNVKFIETTNAAGVTEANVDAELSEDGKTLTVYPGGSEYFKGTYTVEVSTGVKDEAGNALAQKYTSILSVSDTTAPAFVSATASAKTTTNKVTLKFSEPVVDTSPVVKVNGVAGSVAYGDDKTELVVTTTAPLTAGQSYSLQVLNLKDFAGNLLASYDGNVTITGDATAPTVGNVTVVRDNLVEVTFDKAISLSSLQASGAVKLLDGNSADISANIAGIITKPNTTGGKTFQIQLTNSTIPFVNNSFSGTLVFTDKVTDTAGNKIAPTSKPVTLTLDKTAPTVTGVSFKKANATGTYGGVSLAKGALVVKFSEEVAKDAAMDTASASWTLIDNNGAVVTSTYLTDTELAAAKVNTLDKTEVVIPLKATILATDKITSLTVRLPQGQVDDLSLSANTNTSAVVSTTVDPDAVPSDDTTLPTVAFGTEGGTAATGNTFTITASDDVEVDKATLLDLNNYRLDGAPLPAGTYITITGTTTLTAKVNLPVEAISKDKDYALTVSGIKDKAGNTAVTLTENAVGLKDFVAPELSAATLNTNGSLTLSFSEAVLSGANTEADFELFVNDSAKFNTGTDKAFAIADGTGSEAGKYVLTVKKSVIGIASDNNKEVTVNGQTHTTADALDVVKFTFVDVNGSKIYDAGDILISAVDTGDTTAIAFAADGNYDLNSASSVVLATKATPTLVKDASTTGNAVKGDKEITVK
ncbi:S-layer homology domain-containing protein [Brevibacillus invocatus]|uniref:S-layer homology domain-containing protein n=1 Tax=Brevibacillus invocatus TaxID=173959 RepID=A0A3M8CJ25_9BACL|nr:Ig-like domain-containing protein [Brevibacillus invocatus]RNB75732.1 S-layer homology domain-containing protein [Brevibacillus invocatus]